MTRRCGAGPCAPARSGCSIGSTKIACLIGRAEADGRLRALGFGWQKSRGIKSGGIVDLDEAERAIRAAVGTAEDMADLRLKSVYVNLSCGQPESLGYFFSRDLDRAAAYAGRAGGAFAGLLLVLLVIFGAAAT